MNWADEPGILEQPLESATVDWFEEPTFFRFAGEVNNEIYQGPIFFDYTFWNSDEFFVTIEFSE